MGKPTSYIIEQILKEHGIRANHMELAKQKVDNYMKLTNEKDIFFPETEEIIDVLHNKYKLALFTGVTRKQLTIVGDFLKHFELVVAGEEAIKPKPAPDTLFYIAEKMGLQPYECAYVGDMPQDMVLATNAGMTGIGIENEMFSKKELMEAGATKVIKNLKELQCMAFCAFPGL
jgi:phosphoglycolate phosphatase